MPRVNIDDDLESSGRLGAFTRGAVSLLEALPAEMRARWLALGALVDIYRDTQARQFARGKRERLERILRLRFGPIVAELIDVLVAADLADQAEDRIVVRGNKKQIERLKLLREKSTKGGRARVNSASRRKDGTFNPANVQASSSQRPGVSSAPAPAPAPTVNTNTARTHAREGKGTGKWEGKPDDSTAIAAAHAAIGTENAKRLDEAMQTAATPEQVAANLAALKSQIRF